MKRALHREQAANLRGHVDAAIAEARACIELACDVGPALVAAYRAMSALRALREVIDSLPTIAEETTND